MLSYSLGAGCVPWVLVPELFHEDQRGVGSSLAIACNWLGAFVTTLSFSSLEARVQTQGVFWLYSAAAFCAAIFVYFTVPETSGRSLEEIQLMLAPVCFNEPGTARLRKVPSLQVIEELAVESPGASPREDSQ